LVGWKPSIDLESTVYDLFDYAILFKNSGKLENTERAPWNGN
jgi:hypothetical protein